MRITGEATGRITRLDLTRSQWSCVASDVKHVPAEAYEKVVDEFAEELQASTLGATSCTGQFLRFRIQRRDPQAPVGFPRLGFALSYGHVADQFHGRFGFCGLEPRSRL